MKRQRREARRKRAAERRRAAEARKREDARREAARRRLAAERAGSSETGGSGASKRKAVPFVAAGSIAALLILGLGLVPAYVVPWYRMSMVLEYHRQQFTFVGGMGLLAAIVFFALTFLSS